MYSPWHLASLPTGPFTSSWVGPWPFQHIFLPLIDSRAGCAVKESPIVCPTRWLGGKRARPPPPNCWYTLASGDSFAKQHAKAIGGAYDNLLLVLVVVGFRHGSFACSIKHATITAERSQKDTPLIQTPCFWTIH